MMENQNPMRDIFIDKVVLNIGIGPNEDMYQNARTLLEKLTGKNPIKTFSKRRKPELKLRKGQVIGAMITLRNKDAIEMLKRSLEANDNSIKPSSIANNTLSFGVTEYIYFSGVKYDPKIGMLGLNVNASFVRKGKRVEKRKKSRSRTSRKHSMISNQEIAEYMKKNFNVSFIEI
jgi:large subunit ribosomal protein L5